MLWDKKTGIGRLASAARNFTQQGDYCAQNALPGTGDFRQLNLRQADLRGRYPSDQPYLRPTMHANCHAAEIIALADEIRAENTEDWDYVSAIYDYVRNHILFMPAASPPSNEVDTLRRGYGICIDKCHLLVALARAGGVATRYAILGSHLASADQYASEASQKPQTLLEKMGFTKEGNSERRDSIRARESIADNESFIHQRHHPLVEMKVGEGSWIGCDPTLSDDEAAGNKLPLPCLGYDPLMLWGKPGVIVDRKEVLENSKRQRMARRYFCSLICSGNGCANKMMSQLRKEGNKCLQELGRAEYLRRHQRYYVPIPEALAFLKPIT